MKAFSVAALAALFCLKPAIAGDYENALARLQKSGIKVELNELGITRGKPLLPPSAQQEIGIKGLESRFDALAVVMKDILNRERGALGAWADAAKSEVDREYPAVVDAAAFECCKKTPNGTPWKVVEKVLRRNNLNPGAPTQ